MRRALLALSCGVALLLCGAAVSAQDADIPRVTVLRVEGPIDRVVERYVLDGLASAERSGATVVLELDSPGTLDVDPVALATRVHAARVPVVVWIGPTPATGAGAGLLLAHAASIAGVAPGAGVGPLLPLDVAHPDRAAARVEDLVLAWTAERGRAVPPILGEAIPAQAAIDAGVVEVAAPSVTDLLAAIDGETVATAAGDVVLRTRVATAEGERPVRVAFTSLGPADRVLHAAATPSSIYLLLVLGAAALAFELTQPGFGFAGFSGLALAALGAYGLTVVPASPAGLGLLGAGILASVLDVVRRRLDWLSALGAIAFLAGSLLAFRGVAPAIAISPWLVGGATVASVLYYGFVLTVALQSRERITSTQEGLIGLVGETRSELRPEGSVHVKGTLWRGRAASGTIPAGTRVRVRGLDGLVLRVEAEAAPPTSEPEEEEA
ncbi:MAG: NfeD family protein [Actinomycetota bacterium]